MAKYRALKQLYDSESGRLVQPGEEIDLNLKPEDEKRALDRRVIEPVPTEVQVKKK